jgi:hypothetical protein
MCTFTKFCFLRILSAFVLYLSYLKKEQQIVVSTDLEIRCRILIQIIAMERIAMKRIATKRIHYRPLVRLPFTPTSTIGSKSVDHVTIPEASYVSSLGKDLSVGFSEEGIGVGVESKVDPSD